MKDIVDRVYKGRCVALRDAQGADGVLGALGAQISRDGFMRLQVIDLRASSDLLVVLNETLATDFRSLAALAVNENARDTVFLVRLPDGACTADLQTFVRAGRLRPGSETAVVVAVCEGTLEGLGGEHWDAVDAAGLVGPLDGMAFAAAHLSEADGLPIRIKAAVAVEVGAWDLCLTEILLDLPMKHALRPDLCTEQWLEADDQPAAQHLDGWGGEAARHAGWLARNDKGSLTKRVWRGQLGVLFPWIEERRREVISRHRPHLRVTEQTMPEVEMLDWGPIAIQLGNSAKGCPKAVHSARGIRNELAHGRPVTWPTISQCLDEFRTWSAGRV
ncbi:hypothetical protein [Azorhizobium sp. AG788]|uniref:hypothetical protein n=1 Tax=Azorhizobium sp. AG788 TaxID=2183897 RepID=UPI00313A0930